MDYPLGPFGRSFGGSMRSRGPKLADEAVSTVEVAAGAALAGLLTGMSNKRGLKGNTPLLPIPVPLAAGVATLIAAGAVGTQSPKVESHLMDLSKGMIAAYAATFGLKMAYGKDATGKQISPVIEGELPAGYAGQLGPGVGATPETEALFREAGLV